MGPLRKRLGTREEKSVIEGIVCADSSTVREGYPVSFIRNSALTYMNISGHKREVY